MYYERNRKARSSPRQICAFKRAPLSRAVFHVGSKGVFLQRGAADLTGDRLTAARTSQHKRPPSEFGVLAENIAAKSKKL